MLSVKVYKTDIDDKSRAKTILDEIRQLLPGSNPSIDLDDCDKVLRIENKVAEINESKLKKILNSYGYKMEILP